MFPSLEMVLASRDERRRMQLELLARHPDLTLVVATVVIPGPEKRNELSLRIASAMDEALVKAFGADTRHHDRRDLETGYEAFLLVDLDGKEAKRRAMAIEETHPLGRLFDIDVIGKDGIPMSRTDNGGESRRCLICGRDARVCMRLRSHSTEELLMHIRQLTDEYLRRS